MSTVTITARPAACRGPAGAPRTAFVLAGTSAGALNAASPPPARRRWPPPAGGRPSGAGCGAATSSRSARAWSGSGDYAVED